MQAALMLHRQSQTRSGRQRLPAPRASSSPHPRLCNSYTGPEALLQPARISTKLSCAVLTSLWASGSSMDPAIPFTQRAKKKKEGQIKNRNYRQCPEVNEPPNRKLSLVPLWSRSFTEARRFLPTLPINWPAWQHSWSIIWSRWCLALVKFYNSVCVTK